jgi:hypothetical protein
MQAYWFTTLLCAICLEGLGRKYLPAIPSAVFYFFKDIVLLSGFLILRPPYEVRRSMRWAIRGFGPILVAAVVWTVLEMFNPEHQSLTLGLIGLRAYWLWWLAPVLVATSLRHSAHKTKAIYALLVISSVVAILAAVQFASPPTSTVNLYSTVDGQEIYADIAAVGSTGRARVASTFSFLSGFCAFTILVPALLLSIGLELRNRTARRACLVVMMLTGAVVPMSGSRVAIVLGVLVLVITSWSAGLFFTVIGRRIMLGAVVAAVLASVAFPDALAGVQGRFENEDETASRFQDALTVLPPVALATYDYPILGIGTGMQQNVGWSMGVRPEYVAEAEMGRYLVELGPFGFLLVWTARLALAIALIRAYRVLKDGGRRGAAGAALSYAAVIFFGNPVFDHIFQALFFMGCGFILSEVAEVQSLGAFAQGSLAKPVAAER